jgi:CubicO group peptidase (beta-lactamase class C family)
MHRSYFDRTPPHLLPDRSNNYTVEDGVPKANGLDFDTGITVSNSGWNAPIPDLALYLGFLLGGPSRQEEYDAILKRSSLLEMWEPRLPMTDPVAPADDPAAQDSIGLVFFVAERSGRSFVGHTGSQAGFRAFLYVDPKARTAAVAALNSGGDEVLARIRERLFADVFAAFYEP